MQFVQGTPVARGSYSIVPVPDRDAVLAKAASDMLFTVHCCASLMVGKEEKAGRDHYLWFVDFGGHWKISTARSMAGLYS